MMQTGWAFAAIAATACLPVLAEQYRPATYGNSQRTAKPRAFQPAYVDSNSTRQAGSSNTGRYRRGQQFAPAKTAAELQRTQNTGTRYRTLSQRRVVNRSDRPADRGESRRWQDTQSVSDQRSVRPAQHVHPDNKPLPPQILAMPRVRETLEVVHHRSQLLIARGQIIRTAIADESVIDVVQFSPNEVSIIGIGLGATTLTLWFANDPQPLIYLVKTIPDPNIEEQRRIDYGKLERKLQVLFPNSKVYLIPLSQKIVVKGQARDSSEAARILQIVSNEVINQLGSLYGPQPTGQTGAASGVVRAGYPGAGATGVGATGAGVAGAGNFSALNLAAGYIVNMLEVPGEFQVMLRVRIAELNRSQLRRMGIDFNYLIDQGRHAVGYALGGLPATLTGVFENGEVQVLVDWLASNGTAKILSEPVLTVLSGHTALMHSGGEFAVPTIVGVNGVGGQQTTFRGFGTSLYVTPTVIDKDLIRMTIIPEFSTLNPGNSVNNIPGVDSRRVSTTVQLREGQTIAIAGLIAHQMNTEVTKIPWLGDLPLIGPKLFAAKRHTQDETELLVLVTPELVRPMDSDEVPPVPGFYVTPPSSTELYHYGRTEGQPDLEYYQIAPYGRGAGVGQGVGYRLHNPSPATPSYPPQPTDPYGASRQWQYQQYGGGPTYQMQPQYQQRPQYQPPAQPQYQPTQPQYQQPKTPANPVPPAPNGKTTYQGRPGVPVQPSGFQRLKSAFSGNRNQYPNP